MSERHDTTFLKQSLLLTLLLSCSQPQAPMPSLNNEPETAGSKEQKSSPLPSGAGSATAQTGQESGEAAVTPTMITGVFLACDFQPPPAPGATTAKLGCRIAENDTGVKHDMSQHPEYTWGYEVSDTGITVGVTPAASPDDPWHVYYDITNRFGSLDNIQDLLKVGLKLKDGSATYYQKVDTVTGRLGLLLNGTWLEPCRPEPEGSGLYVTTTSTYSNASTVVLTTIYTSDAACATPAQYTSEYTVSLIKLIYNGTGFIADIKYVFLKMTPHNAKRLADMQQQFPKLTFQLNAATDILPAISWPTSSDIIYSNVKLEDKVKPQRLTWAQENGVHTGKTPELRMTDYSVNVPSFKQ
jgi:hypothetical protein